jgi:hypothetical protein
MVHGGLIILVVLLVAVSVVNAFLPPTTTSSSARAGVLTGRSNGDQRPLMVLAKELDATEEDEALYKEDGGSGVSSKLKSSRWDALNPKLKAQLVQAGEERAVANKQKTESSQAKKRRK